MVYIFLYKNEFVVLLNQHSLPINGSERLIDDKGRLEESSVVDRLLALPQFDYDEDLIIISCAKFPENKLEINNIKQIIPLTEKAYLAYERKFGNHINFSLPKKYNVESFYKVYQEKHIFENMRKSVEVFNKYIITEKPIEVGKRLLEELALANVDRILYRKGVVGKNPEPQWNFYHTLFLYQAESHFDRSYPIGFLSHLIASFYCYSQNVSNIQELKRKSPILKYIYFEYKGEFNHLSFQSLLDKTHEKTDDVFVKFGQNFRNEVNGKGLEGDSIKIGIYFLYFRFLLNEGFSFSDILECCNILSISIDKELHSALLLNAIYFDFKKIGDEILHKRNNELFSSVSNADIHEKAKRLIPFLTKEKEIEQKIANEKRREEEKKLSKKTQETRLYSEYQAIVADLKERGYEKARPGSNKPNNTKQIINPKSGQEEIWKKKGGRTIKKKEPEGQVVQGEIFAKSSPQSSGISDQNDDVILKNMNLIKDAKKNDGQSEMEIFNKLYSNPDIKEEIDSEMKWSDNISIEDRYVKFEKEYNNRVENK